MNPERVLLLLERVRSGALEPTAALGELETLPFADLGYAMADPRIRRS